MEWGDVGEGDVVVIATGDIEMRGEVTVSETDDGVMYSIPVSHDELPDVDEIQVGEGSEMVALVEEGSMKYISAEEFEFRRD